MLFSWLLCVLMTLSFGCGQHLFAYPNQFNSGNNFFRSGFYPDINHHQNPFYYNSNPNYFRSGNQAVFNTPEARFFSTFTYTYSTVTTTSTLIATTTCTTSTAALSYCSPGRRRRHAINNDANRGLFYDEEEVEEDDSSSIFVSTSPSDSSTTDGKKTVYIKESLPPVNKLSPTNLGLVFEPEPGYPLPNGMRGSPRLFFTFGTSTVTTSRTTTSTRTITALCYSLSAYQLCGSSG